VFLGLALALAASAWFYVLEQTQQGIGLWDKLVLQTQSISELGLLEGDNTGRSDLWLASFSTFLAHPWLGVGSAVGSINALSLNAVGGHSSWLDNLAQYGILGGSWYFLFLFSVVRRAYRAYRANTRSITSLARLIGALLFVLGGSYNPVVFSIQLEALFFLFVMVGATGQKGEALATESDARSAQTGSRRAWKLPRV
jgi:O-antigen ligase